jgi:hypothetical protein
MSTYIAIAQGRAAQAIADREAAEQALHAVMAAIDLRPTLPILDGILPRRFEMLLEGIAPHRELAIAYGTYRRAENAERKARAAADKAKFDAPPPAGASVASAAMTAAEVLEGIRQRRAA